MNHPARPPAKWILSENIRATVVYVEEDKSELLIERLHGPGAALLAVTADGRLLVNGTDVDVSDDFPAYLGIFDQFAEIRTRSHPGDSVVMDHENLCSEDTESFMGLLYQVDILARRMAGLGDIPGAVQCLRDVAHAIENPGDVAEDSGPIPPE